MACRLNVCAISSVFLSYIGHVYANLLLVEGVRAVEVKRGFELIRMSESIATTVDVLLRYGNLIFFLCRDCIVSQSKLSVLNHQKSLIAELILALVFVITPCFNRCIKNVA